MITELVPIGSVLLFGVIGSVIIWANAKQLARLISMWRADESPLMSLPVGEVVKVTGVIEQHPDAELLPSPFTTTGSDCVSREWHVEEGHKWELVANGYDGVPALLSSNGHTVRIEMGSVEPPLFLDSEKPYSFFREGEHKGLEEFLVSNSDHYEMEDGQSLTRRGKAATVEPGDEVTVIGRTHHTTDARDPARLTIGSEGGSSDSQDSGRVLLSNWSWARLTTATAFRTLAVLYGVSVIGVGLYYAVMEYLGWGNPEIAPWFTLIVSAIGGGYVLIHEAWSRCRGKTTSDS